jgi:hypothetical protein
MSTSARPWVGAPSDEHRAVCVYADEPGSPYCHKPATRHIRVEDATYGEVALASCDTHAPIARASGRFVEEHTYEGFCGIAGTIWVNNSCVLDISGQEPARAQLAEALP